MQSEANLTQAVCDAEATERELLARCEKLQKQLRSSEESCTRIAASGEANERELLVRCMSLQSSQVVTSEEADKRLELSGEEQAEAKAMEAGLHRVWRTWAAERLEARGLSVVVPCAIRGQSDTSRR